MLATMGLSSLFAFGSLVSAGIATVEEASALETQAKEAVFVLRMSMDHSFAK